MSSKSWQFTALPPCIQSVVDHKTRHVIDYRGKLQSRIEQFRTFHQELHAAGHNLFLRTRFPYLIQVLTPAIDLFAEVYLDRANIRARDAQRFECMGEGP